jgi:Rrf2 family transcriptional regulator, iron-sulfur cluster assembly transcription factor
MIFSRLCQYAIQAMTSLAITPRGAARAEKIARDEGIPRPILSKVLQDLVRKGLLESRRGPGGGFTLSRRPELVTLRDIVAAIDGLDQFYTCVTGLSACSDEVPCPLHNMWKEMRVGLMETFETTTLRDLARATVRKKRALTGEKRRAPVKPKTA